MRASEPWAWRIPALKGQRWKEREGILVINSTGLGVKLRVENIIFSPIKVKLWLILFSVVTIMFFMI